LIKIGVVGYGYWGPNLVRNFMAQKNCEVVVVSDLDVLGHDVGNTRLIGGLPPQAVCGRL